MSEPQPQARHRTVMDDESRHVARVYAEALYKAAEAANEMQPVLEELQTLVGGVFKQDPGLELFFASAAISADRKAGVLRTTFEGRTTGTFYRFLTVLNDHERLDMLRGIEEAYRTLHNRRSRKVDVNVTSAVPLTDDERRRLCDDVRAVAQIEPLLFEKVDPAILGGLIIRVQDWVYDASVRTKLYGVRDQLVERSDHGIQSGRDRFGS